MISSLVGCRLILSLRGHAEGDLGHDSTGHHAQEGKKGWNRTYIAQAASGTARVLPGYPEPNVIPLDHMQGLRKNSFSDEDDTDRRSAPGIFIVTEKTTVVDHEDKV